MPGFLRVGVNCDSQDIPCVEVPMDSLPVAHRSHRVAQEPPRALDDYYSRHLLGVDFLGRESDLLPERGALCR